MTGETSVAEEQLRYRWTGRPSVAAASLPPCRCRWQVGSQVKGLYVAAATEVMHGDSYSAGAVPCGGAHCFPAWPPSRHGHDSGLPRIDPGSEHASTLPGHDAPAQSPPTG